MNWEYLAGFFDGEGNLGIGLIKKKAYQLRIRIYSTNKEVLEKIKEFIKIGNIYAKKSRLKTNPTWNLLYEIHITKKEDCLIFLKNVYPYLIIKKEQVNYLLENFDFLRGNKGGGHNNLYFDIDKFRSFNIRSGANKFVKNHTIKPLFA